MSLSSTLGTYVAANHTRTIVPFSQHGTRRLNYYVVEIAGYDIESETGWNRPPMGLDNDWDAWNLSFQADNNHPWEYLESYKSILYPILRGIQIKAEVYLVGYPATVYDGEYPYTQLVFAVADDTALDGESDWQEGSHPNGKSWWYEDAIDESLGLSNGDFVYDDVDVYNAYFNGGELVVQTWTDNLAHTKAKTAINPVFTAARAAKVAANPERAAARAAKVARAAKLARKR